MKRLLFITSAIIIALTAAARQVVCIETGEIVSSDVSTKPIRNVEQLDNGVRVTYRFSHMALDSISPESSALTIAFESFGTTITPNYPALPARMDAIKIPADCDPTITVESAIYEDYFFELAPAPELELEGAEASSGDVKPILTHGFVPEQPALLNRTQQYKGHGLCFVNVVPVLYNHDDKAVRVAREITYLVEYESSAPMVRARSIEEPESCPELDNIALNSSVGEYITWTEAVDIPKDYLIVTTDELKPALDQFVDWKKALGFTVHVTSREKWEDDGVVKDSIAHYYTWYPDLNYLLILGNHDQVPGMWTNTKTNHVTDLYYGFINFGHVFEFMPKVCRGRIPVSNLNEAKISLDKIMAYEVCENMVSSNFFQESLHCAAFQLGSKPNAELTRFIYTSEELVKAARNNGISPQRVYGNYSGSKPLTTSADIRFSNGIIPFPEEITSDDFNWNGKTEDIINAIKQGVSYILFRGHGEVNQWQLPNFSTHDIEKSARKTPYDFLNNPNLLRVKEYVHPIVFSTTCKTGMHNMPDCFASKMMTQQYGGAAGIFAATENSYSGYNDAFILGLFDAFLTNEVETSFISPRTSIPYNRIFRLGQLLNQGLYRIAEKYISFLDMPDIFLNPYKLDSMVLCEYELLHYFGDPSMLIRTQKPQTFSNVKVELDSETKICKVTTGGDSAMIAFYDKNIDKVQCTFATEAEFQFSQIHFDTDLGAKKLTGYENVVIYAPNRIPVIQNTWAWNPRNKLDSYHLTQTTLEITYTIYPDVEAYLMITNVYSGTMIKKRLDPTKKSESIDISMLRSGVYTMSFIVNDNVYTSRSFQVF